MTESTNKVMTDLILLVTKTGHFQEFETGAISDLLLHHGFRPHLNMILPENIVVRILEAITNALEKGAVHMVEYALGVGTKEEHFEAKAIPLYASSALLMIQNVTSYVENRRALKQRNQLLQTVIDTVPPEITAFDNHGNITLINKAAQLHAQHGVYSSDMELHNLLPDGETEFTDEELPLARAFRGEEVYDQIVIRQRNNDLKKTYLVSAVPLKDDCGSINGVVLSERDITDLKNIQHQLKTKIKDLDMFMYRVSHDLKSPLASMQGVLSFAGDTINDPETCSYIEMIRKSHSLLSNIVNDLVNLTRISQKEVEKKSIPLQPFITGITDVLRMMPAAQGIIIKVCVQENVAVYADESLLRTSLQNLICNAILHHRAKGEDRFVLISAFNQSKKVRLEVSDNGPGIAKNIQEKIFDIFYRGSLNTAGSGLGLFIVKQAIEKMDATLELLSEEQAGATFSIIIPKNGVS